MRFMLISKKDAKLIRAALNTIAERSKEAIEADEYLDDRDRAELSEEARLCERLSKRF